MLRDPHDKQRHQDAKSVGASHHETGSEIAHRLAAECAGDPAKLHDLLRALSPGLRARVIAEAQKMYGNAFVQRAMQDIGPGYASAPPGGLRSVSVPLGETPPRANPVGTMPVAQTNPGAGELAHPGDFDRSQFLAGLINPHPTGGGTAPGQRDQTSLIGAAGKLPVAGDYMQSTTKQGNQSDEPAPSESEAPLGPLTEDEQKAADRLKDSVAVNHTGNEHPRAEPDRTPHENTREYPLTWENLSPGRIWAQITRPLTDHEAKFKPSPVFTGRGTRGMPDPTSEAAPSKDELPPMATVIANQQRQYSIPNETSTKGPRLHANLLEAAVASQGQRQAGRIDPGPGDGSTTNLGPGTGPGPGSGIEQVDGTPTTKPGKHPDDA